MSWPWEGGARVGAELEEVRLLECRGGAAARGLAWQCGGGAAGCGVRAGAG